MKSLPVYDKTGTEVGSCEVDVEAIAPRINKQLLHDAVVMYQANRRQGSMRTRSRAEVAGSTKKMYRQKGTGNARAGSKRSNVRRGGGHAFAKRSRDFSYRLPRKALRAATRMALASKILDDQMVVIDGLSFDVPRTGEMAKILKALGIDGHTTLVATAHHDTNVYKSTRNLQGVETSPVSDLNALVLLRPRRVLITKAALESLQQQPAAAASSESE